MGGGFQGGGQYGPGGGQLGGQGGGHLGGQNSGGQGGYVGGQGGGQVGGYGGGHLGGQGASQGVDHLGGQGGGHLAGHMGGNMGGYGGGQGGYGNPFSLSANAAEFVPRFGPPPQQDTSPASGAPEVYQPQSVMQYSQQQIQYQQNMLQHQQHFQQQAQQQHQYNAQRAAAAMQQSPARYGGGYQSQRHSSAASRTQPQQPPTPTPHDPRAQLKQAIIIMTKDPTTFDEKMPQLTTSLASSIETEEKLISMVEDLFKQALEEANFRYTGARLCNYFSHHLEVQGTTQSFKQHMLKRCDEEHAKRHDLVKSSDNRYKLVGFMLFMGELLLNTNEYKDKTESADYTRVLSKAVEELLMTLLTEPADDTLRCVVQVLKLCGSVLEDNEKAVSTDSLTPGLDEIYRRIKSAILESSYIKSLRAQMLSVIELRACDWGRQEMSRGVSSQPSSISNAPPPAPPAAAHVHIPTQVPRYNAMPVNPAATMYYNDQNQQSAPGFGSSGFYPNEGYLYSAGSNSYNQAQNPVYFAQTQPTADDIDPEMAAAYEKFLNNQSEAPQ